MRISRSIKLLLSFALFSSTLSFALDKISIGYLSSTGQGKYFIAKETGIFEKNGLDVTLVEFANSGDGIAAVRAGKLDAGSFGAIAPMVHIAGGAEIRFVAGLMGEDAAIITRKENADKIKSLADVKGKKLGTIRLGTGDAVLRGGLKDAGLNWKKDVSIVELKNPPAVIEAVKNGTIYAGVTWGPHDQRAEEACLAVVLRSRDIAPGHICCRLIALQRKIQGREDIYKRIAKSLLEAEYIVQNDHKKSTEIIAKYIHLSPELVNKAFYSGFVDQTSDPNVKGIEYFWNTMKDADYIQSDKDIKKYVITKFYKDALDELVKENPKETFYAEREKIFATRN